MKIGILDYGLGNVGSVQNMLRKAGAASVLVRDAADVELCSAIVLPGVGAFDSGMSALRQRELDIALKSYVASNRGLLLGICLGMQLLMDSSEEGELEGLGFIAGRVRRFDFSGLEDQNMKIPHMGWNEVIVKRNSPFYAGLHDNSRFYFVHTYHASCANPDSVLATAKYGYEFTCSIGEGNVYGAQFHPEKSHRFGLQLFRNFIDLVEKNAS